MSKDDAKKRIAESKDRIKKQAQQFKGLGKALDGLDGLDGLDDRLIGPRNDIEYRKMLKDIEESGKDE